MPLQHKTSEYLHALDSNQPLDRDRTGWLSGCDISPSSGGPRELTLTAGQVLVGGSTVDVAQTTLAIPDPPSGADDDHARLDIVVAGESGNVGVITGEPAVPAIIGSDGEINPVESLAEVGGNFARLYRPIPAESIGGGVALASIYSSSDEYEITQDLIRDRRVAAIAGGSGGGGGGSGETHTVTPGNVQAALDNSAPNDTIALDRDATWTTATAHSDMPWVFQDRTLEGNDVALSPPNDTTPVIIWHPYLNGQIRNLKFDVPASHDTHSTSDERGIIDMDLDHPNLSFDRTITGGPPKYYPATKPITNCSFIGVLPTNSGDPTTVPQTPAVRIREAGQGFGVCSMDWVTKGMRHHVYIRSEGGTNPDDGTHWGYINGLTFHGESAGDRIPFKLHNIASKGCNRHWFHSSVQPATATEVGIEAIHEGSTARAIIDNRWTGQFWDMHTFDRSHPDGGQVFAAFDGDNVMDNLIINNNRWGPVYSTEGFTGITQTNGAERNGAIDTRDQFALRLTKPVDNGAHKFYRHDGSVFGRETDIGVAADAAFPAVSDRAADAIYFGQRTNQHAAQFLTINDAQETRRESIAPDTNPAQSSDFTTDGTGMHQIWPVDTSGGSVTVTLSDGDMTKNGTEITVLDNSGTASTNPITISPDTGGIAQVSGDATITTDGGAMTLVGDGGGWHRKSTITSGDGGGGGGDGTSQTTVTTTSAYTASDDEVVLADASGGGFDVTLPTPSNTLSVTVKKIDSSSNAVGVATPNSETIDGESSLAINNQYTSRSIVSDGTNYFYV